MRKDEQSQQVFNEKMEEKSTSFNIHMVSAILLEQMN